VEEEPVLDARVLHENGVDRARELHRVELDALRVRARVRVLRLERLRERGDGLAVGLLDELPLAALDLEQVAQVAGVEQELLADVAGLARGAHRDAEAAPGDALGHAEELERAEGLREEGVGAGEVGRGERPALRAREQDDADVLRRRVVLQAPAVLEPGDPGHHHVEDDHVRPCGGDPLGGLGGIRRLVYLDLETLERRSEQFSQTGVVVDQQDSQVLLPTLVVLEALVGRSYVNL
jgi:hypothetical protein